MGTLAFPNISNIFCALDKTFSVRDLSIVTINILVEGCRGWRRRPQRRWMDAVRENMKGSERTVDGGR